MFLIYLRVMVTLVILEVSAAHLYFGGAGFGGYGKPSKGKGAQGRFLKYRFKMMSFEANLRLINNFSSLLYY